MATPDTKKGHHLKKAILGVITKDSDKKWNHVRKAAITTFSWQRHSSKMTHKKYWLYIVFFDNNPPEETV